MNEAAPTMEQLDMYDDVDGTVVTIDDDLVEEMIDIDSMKKPEIIAFIDEEIEALAGPHWDDIPLDLDMANEIKKLKVGEMRTRLKALYGDEEALDSPATTGFNANDLIHQTVSEVEAIKDEAGAIQALTELVEATDRNRFRTGGLLSRMSSEGWCGDHEDFFAFAKAEYGYAPQTVQRMIKVYHALVNCGATWADVQGTKDQEDIGWSVLTLIATLLTPDNWREIFEAVRGMSFATAEEWVKSYRSRDDGEEGGDEGEETVDVTKLSFKIHGEDNLEVIQSALTEVGEESGTSDPGTQLYRLALEYHAGGGQQASGAATVKPGTPAELTKALASMLPAKLSEEMQDALLEILGDRLAGDLDHWPDGMPDQSEAEFLTDLATMIETSPEMALQAISEREDLLGVVDEE